MRRAAPPSYRRASTGEEEAEDGYRRVGRVAALAAWYWAIGRDDLGSVPGADRWVFRRVDHTEGTPDYHDVVRDLLSSLAHQVGVHHLPVVCTEAHRWEWEGCSSISQSLETPGKST